MDLNTVQEIQRAIDFLTPQQREELYLWFDQHHSRSVDAQPKTDRLADRSSVLAEMRALRSRVNPTPKTGLRVITFTMAVVDRVLSRVTIT
jgi:hypothetical protein